MENREETPNRYPENHFSPSPARLFLPQNYQQPDPPRYLENPGWDWDSHLADFNRITLSDQPSGSVLRNRVQSAAQPQSSNFYDPQEYGSSSSSTYEYFRNSDPMSSRNGFMGRQSVGPADSVLRHRVQSAARGQFGNLYGGLGPQELGSTYDEYVAYRTMMSGQNGFIGRPEPMYSSSNRINGSLFLPEASSWANLNQNGLIGPESMYVPIGPSRSHFSPRRPSLELIRPVQPDHMYNQNGPGQAGPSYSGRSSRSNGGPESESNNRKLSDFRGSIKNMVILRDCSGFLRQKIEEGAEEDLELIFEEVKDDVAGIMVNYFGSILVQKLFKFCRPEQINHILRLLIRDKFQFLNICCDNHGSVAMEKLLEKLTTSDQRASVISALSGVVLNLSKDQNGHKVIQHCIINFPDIDALIDEITRDCFEIATHKSGCCVLQNCLDRANREAMNRLMDELGPNVVFLSEHPYGNYVVQYLLGKKNPRVTANILRRLAGNYVSLSMNKCGSNVVEKCFTCTSKDEAAKIILEIANSKNFLMVLQDAFGNYVVQKALEVSQNMKEIHLTLEGKITNFHKFLHSHPYGNRVLSKVSNRPRCI